MCRIEANEWAPCCKQPALIEAYIWTWPFRAAYCRCCGEATVLVGGLLALFLEWCVVPFWDGRIKLFPGRPIRPAGHGERDAGAGE